MPQFNISLLCGNRDLILGSSLHAKSSRYWTRSCCMVFCSPLFFSSNIRCCYWRNIDIKIRWLFQSKGLDSSLRRWCIWNGLCATCSIFRTQRVDIFHWLPLDGPFRRRIPPASSDRNHAYHSERVSAHLCQFSCKLVVWLIGICTSSFRLWLDKRIYWGWEKQVVHGLLDVYDRLLHRHFYFSNKIEI